jgi:hypothetical protein
MPVSLGYIPEGEILLEPSNPSAQLPTPPINPIQIENNIAYPSNDEFAGVFMTTANGPGPTFLARTGTLNRKPTYEAPGGLKVEFYDAGMGGQWFYYGGPPEDAEHANSEPGNEPYPWLASWRGATATRQELPPVDPYAGVPRRICTMEVGSVRDPVTGEMVQYTNGCQRADILAGNSKSTVTAVPYPTDEAQASADALVKLVNDAGEKARMDMAEGIVTRYLEGVAMGAILFESAVRQKLFDMNVDNMTCASARMTEYQTVPTVPAYAGKVAKLQFISETTSDPIGDEYRAKIKFVNMYMNTLKEIAGSDLEGLGRGFVLGGRGGFQWDSTITLKSPTQEKRLFDLVQQASTDSGFGAEVVVSFSPADPGQQNQIQNNIIQAIQTSDSFISKNVGLINSAS